MTYFYSAFSSHEISPRELADVMRLLKAEFEVDRELWLVKAADIAIEVRLANGDIEFLDEESLEPIIDELNRSPKSRVALGLPSGADPKKGLQIIRAICLALADKWPVVLDTHSGTVERIRPRIR